MSDRRRTFKLSKHWLRHRRMSVLHFVRSLRHGLKWLEKEEPGYNHVNIHNFGASHGPFGKKQVRTLLEFNLKRLRAITENDNENRRT
jgi:hypothetical protein